MPRLTGLIAVTLLATVAAAGCTARSPQRLADKSAADRSGRAKLAGDAERARPAQLDGNIALASNAPRHVEPIMITKANFEEVVLNSPVPVMMDCWAPWCGPCKRMLPVVHELAGEYEGRFVIAKLDIEACPEIAARYGVTNIPAFLFFQNGEMVDSLVGAVAKKHLEARLAKVAPRVQPVSREVGPDASAADSRAVPADRTSRGRAL